MYACLGLFVCVPTFNIGLADQSLSIHHTPTVQKKRSSETGTSILPTARSSSTTPNFQHKKMMWSARSNLLLIILSVWTGPSSGSELRRGADVDMSFLDEGSFLGGGRHLTECHPPLSCCPVLKFLSQEQAQCNPDGGYEVAFKVNNTVPYQICQATFPTVLILAGLEPCKDIIKRVIFNLSGPINRNFGETVYPYTVFGDDPSLNVFNDEILPAGQYSLTVRINSIDALDRCILFYGTYKFEVTNDVCAGVCTAYHGPPGL